MSAHSTRRSTRLALWTLGLVLLTLQALATPRHRSVVIDANRAPEARALAERLRAELVREGFEVVDGAQAPSHHLAATVRVHAGPDALGLDVEAHPASGSIARDSLRGSQSDDRTLVLRAVELIIASQLPPLRATPAATARADAGTLAPAAPRLSRTRLELNAGMLVGVTGNGPAVGLELTAARRLLPRLWVGVRGLALARNQATNDRGTASLGHALASAIAAWELTSAPLANVDLNASVGAYFLSAKGTTQSELVAASDLMAVPSATLGVSGGLRPLSTLPLELHARAEAIFTLRRPIVRFGGETIDRMTTPALLGAAGLRLPF